MVRDFRWIKQISPFPSLSPPISHDSHLSHSFPISHAQFAARMSIESHWPAAPNRYPDVIIMHIFFWLLLVLRVCSERYIGTVILCKFTSIYWRAEDVRPVKTISSLISSQAALTEWSTTCALSLTMIPQIHYRTYSGPSRKWRSTSQTSPPGFLKSALMEKSPS